jgi:phosphotransacetylase
LSGSEPRPGACPARCGVQVLVGPEQKIGAIAAALRADLSPFRIVNAAHSHDSADKAVALVRAGEAEALMKGSLHTDEGHGTRSCGETAACARHAASAIAS